MDGGAVADRASAVALEAAGRLERRRRAALDRALGTKRRQRAAQMALSLAEILSEDILSADILSEDADAAPASEDAGYGR